MARRRADDATFQHLAARIAETSGAMDRLQEWAELQAALRDARAGAAAPFTDWALGSGGAAARGALAAAFERQFHSLWADRALESLPALRAFHGDDHRALVDRFRLLDRDWIETSRHRLASSSPAAAPTPRTPRTDSRARHPAGRDPQEDAPHGAAPAVRRDRRRDPGREALFMMSPISVAQYLTPGSLRFDLVVFDEASQVEPPDALGAIARASQLVLVGDESSSRRRASSAGSRPRRRPSRTTRTTP